MEKTFVSTLRYANVVLPLIQAGSFSDGICLIAQLDCERHCYYRQTGCPRRPFVSIPPADRIATFDNDGTLWCEMPLGEMMFTRDRVKEMAAKDAKFKETQPFKAALEGDHAYFHKAGTKALMELVAATHGDMSRDRFLEDARAFFKTAKQPKFGVPYQKVTYLPMIELQKYLRANGFQTWICPGGWMDFMRVVSRDSYGIPEPQIIGSSLKMKFVEKDGKKILWILPQLLAFCDQDDKPVEIALHIGKRPLFSAGNVRSGGDIAHLTYCQGRKGPSFQLMINHDDAKREYAYTEPKGESLKASRDNGWHVVSMRDDWVRIFAFEK